jgi:ADP-ribosyl-[dinitrogen reductase] hydrolase
MRGSCLCGQVRYEVSQLDSPIRHCSCRTCRKAHAAAYNTSASARQEHFRWLAGADRLTAYESSAGKHRYFCSRCGTQVIAQHVGSDTVILRMATLDDDPGQRPQGHIWMSHAVPWLDDGPGVPRHAEWAPDLSG